MNCAGFYWCPCHLQHFCQGLNRITTGLSAVKAMIWYPHPWLTLHSKVAPKPRHQIKSCAADSRSTLLGLRPPRDSRVMFCRQATHLHKCWQPVRVIIGIRLPCWICYLLHSRRWCALWLSWLARMAGLLPGHTAWNPGHGSWRLRDTWRTAPRHARHWALCPVGVRPRRTLLPSGVSSVWLHRIGRRCIACRSSAGRDAGNQARHSTGHGRSRVRVPRCLLEHRVRPRGLGEVAARRVLVLHLRRVVAASHGPIHCWRSSRGGGICATWVEAVWCHTRCGSSILHIHPSCPTARVPRRATRPRQNALTRGQAGSQKSRAQAT
mmetsp:Transcript_15953/g.39900  ORF Transcript_15953/g.39900 Transcript_15953/m.39900 type:complete len:323 (+) Transcript_15953:134-1102(+)